MIAKFILYWSLLVLLLLTSPLEAQTSEKRIALVIGNADYHGSPLQTSANDAGLIAQTLQAAGFDVVALAISTRSRSAVRFATFLKRLQLRP